MNAPEDPTTIGGKASSYSTPSSSIPTLFTHLLHTLPQQSITRAQRGLHASLHRLCCLYSLHDGALPPPPCLRAGFSWFLNFFLAAPICFCVLQDQGVEQVIAESDSGTTFSFFHQRDIPQCCYIYLGHYWPIHHRVSYSCVSLLWTGLHAVCETD